MLVHLKKHQLLFLIWIMLFMIITKNFGLKMGIPYLFLDPEYLGKVGGWSFFILGFAFGGFVMTWNVTHYILNSFRFPFLATLNRPFTKYCLNNALLPLLFVITYIIRILNFQEEAEFQLNTQIFLELGFFLLGTALIVILSLIYFFNTNKDIFKIFGLKREDFEKDEPKVEIEDVDNFEKYWRVDFFLATPFRSRIVRGVSHYESNMLRVVFRQHHVNAVIIQAIGLGILLSLGLLIDYPVFRIPAGASVFLLLSILIMVLGAFSFWMRGWRTLGFIALFLLINYLIKYNVLDYVSQAAGLKYTEKKEYSIEQLQQESSSKHIDQDMLATIQILDNWKAKMAAKGYTKPKMVLLNASGGGSRAATWTVNVIEHLDSMMGGEFLDHTTLMSGASAGMIGATYYRELFLRKKMGLEKNVDNAFYNISKDILNPLCFTFIVNDFFIPWQAYRVDNQRYSKDRGYIFEKIISENTNHVMNKKLIDYTIPEREAIIPMAMLSATIINNGQRLYMSAQPVSYMTRPVKPHNLDANVEVDAIDFGSFFKGYGADNLKFITALRMNASFPYITPTIALPTEPAMQVMDAGMRDNFGNETTIRFLHVFRDWINKNTSGVVIIQIRDTPKVKDIKGKQRPSITDKIFNPIGNFYTNWTEFQDYYHDNIITYAASWSNKPIDVVRFEYVPQNMTQEVSLSWHLTTREKLNIRNAINTENNQQSLLRVKNIIEGK